MRTTLAILLLALVARTTAAAEQPDVVFIIVDDLNDWLGCLGGHPEDANEWTNQAANPECKKVKESLARLIPEDQHPGLKVQDWYDRYQ